MTGHFPPPILSLEPGSWAHSTVSERLPDILLRVQAENDFSPPPSEKLARLGAEIPDGQIRNLSDPGAPDLEAWQGYITPWEGKGWLEVPWFFAEHYFYRRIMEAVAYFRLGKDPFAAQKQRGLEASLGDVAELAGFLSGAQRGSRDERMLQKAIYFSLWGNQADLSLWPAGSPDDPKHPSQQTLQDHLLANDIQAVIRRIRQGAGSAQRVDILLDNAGFELVADLALVDILLGLDFAGSVVLHVKAHPTFVSDVIEPDIGGAIDFLSGSDGQEVRAFGKRLEEYRKSKRLQIQANFFWNSPLPLWELPEALRQSWAGTGIVISKGDANYRRILGDRQWDFTTPFQEAVNYLPAPLAAFRTLKAELALGLTLGQIQEVFNQDKSWMTNGRWGVIHYAPASPTKAR